MKPNRFFRDREPITVDISDQVLAKRPRYTSTLMIPFTTPDDYWLHGSPPSVMPQQQVVEVGYERYSMTTMLSRLVDSKEWGSNRIEYFDDRLVTMTFIAPNTMRIRG